MKTKIIIFLTSILVLSSCVSTPLVRTQDFKSKTHSYSLDIVDINDKPIQGASVHYILKNEVNIVKDTTVVTNSDGKITVSLTATSTLGGKYVASYYTLFEFTVSKRGYSSYSGLLDNDYGKYQYLGQSSKSDKIELVKLTDYFKPDFMLNKQNETLVSQILDFINTLKNQSQISNSKLKGNSIFVHDFKENKYLSLTFENMNVFNSIKLNKYDIAKILFDEVVRKILNPLNDNLSKSDLFYGYDITVIGYTKSFVDEYALSKKIVYQFMIPKQTVSKYKNKDITGQQVLDQSIILMDDERIELKLQ